MTHRTELEYFYFSSKWCRLTSEGRFFHPGSHLPIHIFPSTGAPSYVSLYLLCRRNAPLPSLFVLAFQNRSESSSDFSPPGIKLSINWLRLVIHFLPFSPLKNLHDCDCFPVSLLTLDWQKCQHFLKGSCNINHKFRDNCNPNDQSNARAGLNQKQRTLRGSIPGQGLTIRNVKITN